MDVSKAMKVYLAFKNADTSEFTEEQLSVHYRLRNLYALIALAQEDIKQLLN